MEENKILKGIDLVKTVHEFIYYTPTKSHWKASIMIYNMSKYLHLQQIKSLFQAFMITDKVEGEFKISKNHNQTAIKNINIETFLDGKFITQRSMDSYKPLFDYIEQHLKKTNTPYPTFDEPYSLDEVVTIYKEMMETRRLIYNIGMVGSNHFALATPLGLARQQIVNQIAEDLFNNIQALDEVLELIINPFGLSFSENELHQRFDYPIFDKTDFY